MVIVLIVAAVVAVVVWYFDLTRPLPAPDAAPAPDASTPSVPVRATCSRIGHHMVLSELGTWWYCEHDGCDELWPADEAHHVDLPYDREAVQLVDEVEQHLRRVS